MTDPPSDVSVTPDPSAPRDAATPPPERPQRPRFKRMAIYLLLLLLAWVVLVLLVQRAVLFPRYLIPPAAQTEPPAAAEVWHLDPPAGPVEAWFLPADGVDADQPGPAVVFAHGNGELIDHWPTELAPYRRMGVSVLLPEYRGYGRSAGTPSQRAIVSDFVAFHDRLAQHPRVDPDRIVFHGRSAGSGVIAQLATHRRPAAIILQSSFTSVAAMARRYLVPRVLMRDPFDVLPVVRQYTGPVLILHGRHDDIIPPSHARQLHAAAPDSELILYDVDHNTLPPPGPYWRDIERFLHRAEVLPAEEAVESDVP